MFEKYWKPYFDTWSENVNDALERIMENPVVLKRGADGLGWIFRGKKITDQTLHTLLTNLGLSAYREQKKSLYILHQLHARTEDLQDEVQDLKELIVALKQEIAALQQNDESLEKQSTEAAVEKAGLSVEEEDTSEDTEKEDSTTDLSPASIPETTSTPA